MTYRIGNVSEVSYGETVLRPGDDLSGYTIAEITLKLYDGVPVLLCWETVGDELHARRYAPASSARWINFYQATSEES
ncbi:MAG: hypothetical protein AB8G17_06580 [Gammaproteobacteria bacterium]